MTPLDLPAPPTRREMLCQLGGGFGTLGLMSVLASDRLRADPPSASAGPLAPRAGHFPARAKRVIFLFMNGGPSHVDTFDPKPALDRYNGALPPERFNGRIRGRGRKLMKSPFRPRRFGQSGIAVADIYPEIGNCIDDICVIRSVHTDSPA